MKVLVFGSSGMLGKSVLKVFNSAGKEVEILAPDSKEVDITDIVKLDRYFEKYFPMIVVHLAAYTDVDGCEQNQEKAYLVNTLGTANIVSCCLKYYTELLYISTDYVFNGEKLEYYEWDEPDPLNVYGRSKLYGEEVIKAHLNKFYIVRTSWLFGEGKNFVDTMLNLAKSRTEIDVVNDQCGAPTYCDDLAEAIFRILEKQMYGVYHVTAKGKVTWADFARKIFELTGLNIKVNDISSQDINRPALRPANSILVNYFLEKRNIYKMCHWQEGLKKFLKKRGVLQNDTGSKNKRFTD